MQLNKIAIANSFGRAVDRYDDGASLQRWVGDQLLAKFRAINQYKQAEKIEESVPLTILDVGTGTGYLSQKVKGAGRVITALDLSKSMLNRARENSSADHYILGDMEILPFLDHQFDWVITNLAIQWCRDFNRAIAELIRVTKKGGGILFTTVADGSLHELESAWRAVDNERHILPFLTKNEIEKALQPYNYELLSLQKEYRFPTLIDLMRSLQTIGATAIDRSGQRGLMGRTRFNRLAEEYTKTDKGEYPLTYQIILGVIYP